MLIRLPLPQCFCPRGRKLRPWSEKNSDQNSDHPRLCIYWGKEKLRPWSEFLGRENSDHGLSFGCFGVGVDEGALKGAPEGGRTLRKDVFLPSKHLLSANWRILFRRKSYGYQAFFSPDNPYPLN